MGSKLKEKILKMVEGLTNKDLNKDGRIGDKPIREVSLEQGTPAEVSPINPYRAGTVKWAVMEFVHSVLGKGNYEFTSPELVSYVRMLLEPYGKYPLDSTILRELRTLREKMVVPYKYVKDEEKYILIRGVQVDK